MHINKINITISATLLALLSGVFIAADRLSNHKTTVRVNADGNIRVEEIHGKFFKSTSSKTYKIKNLKKKDNDENQSDYLDPSNPGSKVTKNGVTIEVLPDDYNEDLDNKAEPKHKKSPGRKAAQKRHKKTSKKTEPKNIDDVD